MRQVPSHLAHPLMVGLGCFMTGVLYRWDGRVAGINRYSLLPPLSTPGVPVNASDPKRQDSAQTMHWGWEGERPSPWMLQVQRVVELSWFLSWQLFHHGLDRTCLKISSASRSHPCLFPLPRKSSSTGKVKLTEPNFMLSKFHDYGARLPHAPSISPTSLRLGLHWKCFQF